MYSINPDVSTYTSQLHDKVANLKTQLATLGKWVSNVPLMVHDSAPMHYRMRVEFRIWHDQDDIFYAMFDPNKKNIPIKVEQFLPASLPIYNLMPKLIQSIKLLPACCHKLFQINFLSTQTGQLLVTLLYHRPLDEAWEKDARQLMQKFNINIIGRSRKQTYALNDDYLLETLNVEGRSLHYQQYENAFSQPNAGINEKMIAWVCAQSSQLNLEASDLLELYCGNGNFTVPLGHYYPRILATEIAKRSVRAAQYNLQLNGITNVDIIRLSSAEVSEALGGVRLFRRLAHINLSDYNLGTVLVDPPRAGLDKATLALVSKFDRIIYISCNPTTFIANLHSLKSTHRVLGLAMFDQFPYTPHVEVGVILQAHTM